MSQGAISNALCSVHNIKSLAYGLIRHRLKTTTKKKIVPFLRIMIGIVSLSVRHESGADQTNRTPCLSPHGPKMLPSSWISPKTDAPDCMCIGLMWYLLMSAGSPTPISKLQNLWYMLYFSHCRDVCTIISYCAALWRRSAVSQRHVLLPKIYIQEGPNNWYSIRLHDTTCVNLTSLCIIFLICITYIDVDVQIQFDAVMARSIVAPKT